DRPQPQGGTGEWRVLGEVRQVGRGQRAEPRPVPRRAAAIRHGGVLRGRVWEDGRLHGAGQRRDQHQARRGRSGRRGETVRVCLGARLQGSVGR
ncbi:unnamed protein product, partial [Ectocarpus fasciculatus]